MKTLTLLLIPLIFLSSCTIDWNGEKDKKIDALTTENTLLKNNIAVYKTKMDKMQNIKGEEILQSITGNKMEAICSNTGSVYTFPDMNNLEGGNLLMSIIVKDRKSLFYFKSSDEYHLFKHGDLGKSDHPKGYIYTFNEYNCEDHTEKILIDASTMKIILGALPKNLLSSMEHESSYYPDIDYNPDIISAPSFFFFGGIVSFNYNSGAGIDGSELECKILVDTNTRQAMISCDSDGIRSGDRSYYKTITY